MTLPHEQFSSLDPHQLIMALTQATTTVMPAPILDLPTVPSTAAALMPVVSSAPSFEDLFSANPAIAAAAAVAAPTTSMTGIHPVPITDQLRLLLINMSGLSDAHQLKNEPIDPSYPLSNLGHMGMPGFEMLSSPYASSARSHSEGSLVLPPQLRRSSRASVDGFSRCRHCPKKLSTPEQMEEHMVECKLDRVHQCTRCEKRFKARGGLQQHMRIHDEVKPFECTFCQKRFTQKSHIDQHLRIHTGLKPFSCRYCGRLFRQRSQQLGHENTHFNTANNRLMNLPLQMPPAECEPALNLSHQHSPHSGQSSPIPPVTVSSPYAPMPAPSDNIAALLGMHTGAPPQMIVPCTTFQPIDLINTTTH